MSKLIFGVILIIIGVIALVSVHSMRPPSGFGDALMMMSQGRGNFIKEPFYQVFMALSGLIALFGVLLTMSGWRARSSGERAPTDQRARPAPGDRYACRICGKSYKFPDGIKAHIRSTHNLTGADLDDQIENL